MKVPEAIVEVLKREGAEFILGYPVNPVLEASAAAGIRPIIVRQERTGIHMGDAYSRLNSGERIGIFAMQHGPGTENAFGGVAQAFSESVPMVIIPGGYARNLTDVFPNFNASLNYRHVTKWCEQVTVADATVEAMRRAFTQARNGRPGPALVEFPADIWREDFPGEVDYTATPRLRSAPDPRDVEEAARALVEAQRPVIYAGQGVHYARAWDELRELAELLEIPVTTSLEGKSAFPENHPLSLWSGGRSLPGAVYQHVQDADVIFGIGCSFSRTSFGIQMPAGKTYIHATVDPMDVNKDVPAQYALIGDARLTLQALLAAARERIGNQPRGRKEKIVPQIEGQREEWLQKWLPKLTSAQVPLSPYRVIWDLLATVDVANTIITHDAGSPRDQLSPFWQCTTPLSYIGWGKTTQLGYSLGLAMGAKLARPDKLCINVWGDAAIGMTGLDFETAVRERIPILSVLFNNFSMAMEIPVMQQATARFNATDISGNYAEMARALGGYGERVTEPSEIVPAITRGIEKTRDGHPALLEFITAKEIEYSYFGR
jgi:thiamine pyrophosphate-dependent acetolactate synthase large subunit-like protein